MSPAVVLEQARRRILLPFALSLNAISIAALVLLDAQKSLALKYDGESLGASSNQNPALNKAGADSESNDATKFRDKDLTSVNADSNPDVDGLGSASSKPSVADSNANINAHHVLVTVVGSSAYPQILPEPSPTKIIADAIAVGPDTSKLVSDSTAAESLFASDSNWIALSGALTNPAGALQVDTTAPAVPTIISIVLGGAGGNHWVLTGTAEANSTVAIFDGNTQLATVTASGSGSWSYTTTGSITRVCT